MKTNPKHMDDKTRAQVLRFFRTARFTNDLAHLPIVAEQNIDRKALVHCLEVAGLLEKVRGATRGTVYITSALGEALLALLERAHSAPDAEKGDRR